MQYKVRSLPTRGVPNAIYFLLTNQGTVQQFITDEQGGYRLVVSGNASVSAVAGVKSVNGETGEVVLTTDDIPEGIINKYYDSLQVINDVTNLNISIFNNDAGYVTAAQSVGAYTHTQSVPEDIWIITHNLGFYPNVTVADSSDRVVQGDIQYNNINQLTLSFMGAFSGKAYLS